jgi:hypothetical protein
VGRLFGSAFQGKANDFFNLIIVDAPRRAWARQFTQTGQPKLEKTSTPLAYGRSAQAGPPHDLGAGIAFSSQENHLRSEGIGLCHPSPPQCTLKLYALFFA